MEKTTLYLPAELQEGLREASRRSGRPQAQIVREAVAQYLAGVPEELPACIGSGSDPTLDARDLEAILDAEWGADDHGR